MNSIVMSERIPTTSKMPKVYDVNENKKQRYKRLSKARLAAALEKIRLLENLLENTNAYSYTHKDVEELVMALQQATNKVKSYWDVQFTCTN